MTLEQAYELWRECKDERDAARDAGSQAWAEAAQKRLASLEKIIRRKEAEKAEGQLG